MYGWMDVWMYGMDVCMYGCMDGWMDVWMYGCMDVWMYGCMYVCLFVCIYIYIFILYACMYVYIDIDYRFIYCHLKSTIQRWLKTGIRIPTLAFGSTALGALASALAFALALALALGSGLATWRRWAGYRGEKQGANHANHCLGTFRYVYDRLWMFMDVYGMFVYVKGFKARTCQKPTVMTMNDHSDPVLGQNKIHRRKV